jgi:hypothetical protein
MPHAHVESRTGALPGRAVLKAVRGREHPLVRHHRAAADQVAARVTQIHERCGKRPFAGKLGFANHRSVEDEIGTGRSQEGIGRITAGAEDEAGRGKGWQDAHRSGHRGLPGEKGQGPPFRGRRRLRPRGAVKELPSCIEKPEPGVPRTSRNPGAPRSAEAGLPGAAASGCSPTRHARRPHPAASCSNPSRNDTGQAQVRDS